MTSAVLEMDRVYKKFNRGETYDSLRDLIPALCGRLLGPSPISPLKKNEFWAVRDVSFSVDRGEALGIIGSNGAGKSTILKLLCGVMKPTEGRITTNGALSALIEVGAGFHPDLTGRENIFLNGTILGMKKEQIKQRFDDIVEFSGLAEFIDTPVKRYSSGMYARLGFSVAAHVNPDILIVDEVLSVGDHAFQKKCLERMKSILRDGATVIFVSHNLRAVADICGSCILLERGGIVRQGRPDEVIASYVSRGQIPPQENSGKEVHISKAHFRGENGTDVRFESGQRTVFEVEITGRARCENLSVSMALVDYNNYMVFNTSTKRLTGKAFSLEAGETKKITFETTLHLAAGTYGAIAYVYRYDPEKLYDQRALASSIYISSSFDIRGVANLYPVVRVG